MFPWVCSFGRDRQQRDPALIARMIGRPLQTFSVAFKDGAPGSPNASRRGGTSTAGTRARWHRRSAPSHMRSSSTTATSSARFRSCVSHEDEPTPTLRTCRSISCQMLARISTSRSVLTGEGVNELLTGSGRHPRHHIELAYQHDLHERMCPSALRSSIASGMLPMLPSKLARYAKRSFLGWTARRSRCSSTFRVGPSGRQQQLLPTARRRAATRDAAYGAWLNYFNAPNGSSTLLDGLLYADVETLSSSSLLMKQARVSGLSIYGEACTLSRYTGSSDSPRHFPIKWKLNALDHQARPAQVDEGAAPRLDPGPRPIMACQFPCAHSTRVARRRSRRADILLDRPIRASAGNIDVQLCELVCTTTTPPTRADSGRTGSRPAEASSFCGLARSSTREGYRNTNRCTFCG